MPRRITTSLDESTVGELRAALTDADDSDEVRVQIGRPGMHGATVKAVTTTAASPSD